MAKKNIPLVKPKGTTSEGNINVTGGPLVLDLGDFDDIFGSMESDSPKQGPLGEFYTGMKESFKDRFKTKDIVRNFLRSAAPDGISNLMGFADEAVSATKDIKDSIERTNASDLQYIAKRAQKLLPQLQEHVPEGMYNKISQGLEDKIDEYDYTVQSQRDQTPIRRAQQEQRDGNEIKAALDNVALTEKLNHNRSEQAAQLRHNQNRAESSIRDLLQTKRFDFMAKSMGMAVDSLQRMAGYTEQVNYGFQRKGLELQFRSYLGIKELVKLQEANLELNTRAYNAMIRNTGMTDFQKNGAKGLTEMGGPSRRNGFIGRTASMAVGKTLSGYLGNFGNEAQSRVTNSLSQKLSMAVMAMKMGEQGPNLWDNKYKMAGNLAGDYASDFILNELIPMLGREARPGITNISNKHFGGKHNQIGYYLDNMPSFLQDFVNNNQNTRGIKGGIRNLIAPYVPQFGLQDRLQSGTFQTIDQPAQFNQMTQRTIVDALPGYLARLLQEVRMIRTGSNDVAREVFDVTTGKFTVESAAHDNLTNKIIPKSAIRSASTTINDALNTIDADGKLSPQARKALAERMLRDASTNRRADPEEYIKSRGYAKDLPPEVTKELDTFFNSKFEMKDGKLADTASNHQLRQEFSQAFLDIRSISRDPIKEIQRMINTGHTEPLRAVGIITTTDGIDKINYPRIWEILRSGVTDTNPFAPGGDGIDLFRDDRSGDKGHASFVGPMEPGKMDRLHRFRSRYAPEEQAARDKMAKHLKMLRGRFGSAAASLQDIPEHFEDIKGSAVNLHAKMSGKDYTGQMSNMYQTGLAGYDNFVGSAATKVNDVKEELANRGKDIVTDLYTQFDKTHPAIRAEAIAAGDLIDVNTKKVITKIGDITGKVIDSAGNVVLSANEAAAGLMNPKGEIVLKTLADAATSVTEAIARSIPPGLRGEGTKADPNSDEELDSQDWALGPGESPVITARGLINGEYVDAAGRVVSSLKDIAGDVFDKSGNLIMSAKEFAGGLWSRRTGKRYQIPKGAAKLLGLVRGASKYAGRSTNSLAWGAVKFTAKAALGIATKAFNFFVDNQNAYIPGEPIPVLTRRGLQNGEYFDDKGKVLENFTDAYSVIYNAQGEPVVSPELYPQLKNYDGSKHILAKNRSIWARYVMRPMRAVRSAYMKASVKYWKALGRGTSKAGKWLGNKLFGGLARTGGNVLDRMFDRQSDDPAMQAQMNSPQTQILGEILGELRAQRPEEVRKGSWLDQMRRKKEGKGDTSAPDAKAEDQKAGWISKGLKGLAGLFGFGKKKKGEDESEEGGSSILSDVADVASIGDALRGKGKGGGAGKGRLARWGSKLMQSGAGRAIAGSFVGRGLAVAGTAIAGLLSAPVLIGAAAVTVTAGAAYFGYNRYKNITGDFRELRFAQYGVDKPTDKSFLDDVMDMSVVSLGGDKIKVLKLEALLEQYTDKNTASPTFSIAAAGGKKILSTMGIDTDDEAQVIIFSRWLEKRFKPVFLSWQSGLYQLGQGSMLINDVDDKLPDELKADFLNIIKFPYSGDTPYACLDNPFSAKYPLKDNTATIEKMFDTLSEKYGKLKKEKSEKSETETKGAEAGKDTKTEDGTKAAAVAGTAGAGVLSAKALADESNKEAKAKGDVFNTPGIAATAGAASTLSGTIADFNQRIGRTLTSLQSIRMRAYGLQVLTTSDVKALLALEAVYVKDLKVSDFSVDYTGSEGELLKEAGRILGKDVAVGSADRIKLYNWLINRFAPVFRAYYGTAMNEAPIPNLAGLESKLNGGSKVIVANAMLGAIAGNGDSVWSQPSLFDVTGPLSELKTLADADLAHLKEQADKDVANTPTQKSSDQVAGKAAADSGGSFTDKVMGTIKDTWNSTKETVSSAYNRAADATSDTYASAKIALGMGPDYGEGGAKGGSVQSSGTTGSVVAGNGGQWESIPMPTASGSIKAAYPTLKAVSEMTGVPLDWLLVMCGLESGFRYDVKAGTSSATGWFQFIDSTWDFMIKQAGAKYGIPADPGRTLRTDPRVNALMGAEFIKYNLGLLSKALGRSNFTDTDLYMAHFLGAGGAIKFFRADPNAMAYKVFPKEYSANMPLFFVGGRSSQPRTIAQLYQLFQDKINKFWATTGAGYRSGNTTVGEPATPQEPGAVQDAKAVEEETVNANMKADAKDKDGLGANAPDDQGGATAQPTVSSLAKDTGPMPGAPTGAGGSGPSSSVNNAGTNSGGADVDAQRQAQMDAATAQNTRRESEVRRDQKVAKDVNDVQQEQLNTLWEIRDINRSMLDALRDQAKMASEGADSSRGGSQDSMTPTAIKNRPALERPSSLTLR